MSSKREGAFNLDPRSAGWNTEMGLRIESPALNQQIRQTLQRDLARQASLGSGIRRSAHPPEFGTAGSRRQKIPSGSFPPASDQRRALAGPTLGHFPRGYRPPPVDNTSSGIRRNDGLDPLILRLDEAADSVSHTA